MRSATHTPHNPYLFFSHCSADPRHRHSFPTRRSSDLAIAQVIAPGEVDERPSLPSFLLVPSPLEVPAESMRLPWSASARSEEHTSELQSHSDLVCRLLRENKNPTPCCTRIRPCRLVPI